MEKSKDSIVVPIGEYAFSEILKSKIYFFPKPRTNKIHLKYVFFYRVKPIQAITHFGVIETFIEDADNLINIIEKMKSFKEPSKIASAYKFSSIVELDNKIFFDIKGFSIQGRINGNFEEIKSLKTTKGLFNKKNGK
ncbi:MAG: hypothetical protein NDI94_02210, partial [Candidatus Woesearchaeota archaeon]|nr:hypothetical protein [Candidatus Woesearchaeota archaeon]